MDFDIHPKELKALQDHDGELVLVDVRTHEERDTVTLGGVHIPLDELPDRITELDREKHHVVYCHHGPRSALAVQLMRAAGFNAAQNLAGGIDRYAEEIDRDLERY